MYLLDASKDTIGISISHTNSVHIDSLTISNCLTGLSFTSVFHKSFYRTSVQNCNTCNDIDIFGQEWNEADLFFMNESSISNISRENIRVQE